MPRPPLLPIPDRKAIFEAGLAPEQWLDLGEYTEQNQKMLDLLEDTVLDDTALQAVGSLERTVNVIAIAEAWCGDVIRHAPYLLKLAEASNGRIQVRFVTRDQDLDFFARFLTNGGEAVPKFVFCSDQFTEVGSWGPMSSTPKRYIAIGKSLGDIGAARVKVGEFYNSDGGRERQKEILDLIAIASAKSLDI